MDGQIPLLQCLINTKYREIVFNPIATIISETKFHLQNGSLLLSNLPGLIMPTYPVKHKETGEQKELYMSMKEYDQWKLDNPDWEKDWSAGVGGVTYGMPKQSDGFKEVMSKVQKAHPRANLSRYL